MKYDLVIVGGGPAGIAAGIYAGRKKLAVALVADTFGGQSLISADIQNWVGVKSISGFELGKMLEGHLRTQENVEIIEGDLVQDVKKSKGGFVLTTKNKRTLEAKTVLIATGSHRKRLDVPGEREFEGKGVVYCSICDAPLFSRKAVAVVGGGNSGLEAVVDLLPYASKIYLLHRGDVLKGDPVTAEKIRKEKKVSIILNALTQAITGTESVQNLRYKDKTSEKIVDLPVHGVFVEVGIVPSSEIVKNLVNVNERGEIIVDQRTFRTSLPGMWAAGDVTDVLYKQNNISVGDAIKAVLNIYDHLNDRKRY